MALQVRRAVTGHDKTRTRGRAPKRDQQQACRETVVHPRAGDVPVQRGTVHNWIDRGTEPCVIAFVLIEGAPVRAGGKTLAASG